MRKLEENLKFFISAENDSKKPILVAWDFDERLYKKLHFISQDVAKKHGLALVEMKSPWPHISAVYIKRMLTFEERHKFKLAAHIIKPKFTFKQLDVFVGKDFDYLAVEFNVPNEYIKFEKFAEDVCGKENIMKYPDTRPHVSFWAIHKKDTEKVKEILPEMKTELRKYFQSFIPVKVSFWVDFEIDEIESIAFIKSVKQKYRVKSLRIEADYNLNKLLPKHPLFHATNAAVQILVNGEGICSDKGSRYGRGNTKSISLTRDITWLLDGRMGKTILVLDRNEIKTKFKLEPLDAHGYMSDYTTRKEEREERVWTNCIPAKYVKALITLLRPYKTKSGTAEYTEENSAWPKTITYIYYNPETKKAEVL